MILVTGATGTVSSQVLQALLEAGAPVRAAVHTRRLEIPGVETCTIDYDRPETLPTALEGIDTVLLASYATLHETAMVDAARAAGVGRMVKLSAWQAADEAFTIARWHREVERAIEDRGLAWTFLRPDFFMQNLVTYMGGLIVEEGAIYEPAGDARVSYIDAGDIGYVAARVLTEPGHEGRAYDLSGPQALTHDEVAEQLTEALGRTVRHVRVSDDTYRRKLLEIGFPEEDAAAYTDAYRYGRTGALSTVTTHVADLTGRPPRAFGGFCRDHAPLLARGRSAPAGR